jgi:glutamate transport system substrate-binding protein
VKRSVIATIAVALVASGCAGGGDPKPQASAPASPVEATPTVPDGSVLQRIRSTGKVRIGVKLDVPLFGLKGDDGTIGGFDIRIAHIVADELFPDSEYPNDDATARIVFSEALSKDRERFLQDGSVDVVISTYTITESRKQFVDFAGPYYIAGQDILARTADIKSGKIAGIGSLNGKRVCAVTGSTSLANLIAAAPTADTSVTAERYPDCFEALRAGRVDAMTTDDVILLGLAQQDPGEFALTGNPFHTEPYGIGIPKGDEQLRALINNALETAFADGRWEAAFRETVATVGASVPSPPVLQR